MQRLLVVENTPEDKTENSTPEIFCLGDEFFKDEYAKPNVYRATDEEAKNIAAVYL